jgi:shikimate dehydrogenase
MELQRSASQEEFLTGLIGAPIAHSASPAMHERAAEALGLRCRYQLIEIAGADQDGLRRLLDDVRRKGFAGVNVTFPYKETCVPLLDELTPEAAGLGAVNTVVFRNGRSIGHNTDMTGFARAIAPHLAGTGDAIAVIGAGGVGKAIAFALARLGVRDVRIFDSEPARAAGLARRLAGRDVVAVTALQDALDGATGLVNATPVGMLPSRDTPVPEALLHPGLWVADAVYSPLMTPLLIAAQGKRARIMTGRNLAIYQAADAFELFTGHAASVEIMGEAFDGVMAARSAMTGSGSP